MQINEVCNAIRRNIYVYDQYICNTSDSISDVLLDSLLDKSQKHGDDTIIYYYVEWAKRQANLYDECKDKLIRILTEYGFLYVVVLDNADIFDLLDIYNDRDLIITAMRSPRHTSTIKKSRSIRMHYKYLPTILKHDPDIIEICYSVPAIRNLINADNYNGSARRGKDKYNGSARRGKDKYNGSARRGITNSESRH